MSMQRKGACDFCQAVETGRGTPLFSELYGQDQIISVSHLPSSFTVLQDSVPLGIRGAHLLLIPKPIFDGHDISLAVTHDQCALKEATDIVTLALQACFPEHPVFVFEHGAGFVDNEPIACGGCHLDHAHGHFLVLPQNTVVEKIIREIEKTLAVSGWDNLPQQK